ncbi:hypothetical protein RDI58_028808 [Solanum bulbocastanum]|uniref:Uncharacterized protein n=1 Tax=Solanum bulbocastanum TaxID=147425 RepID=A0AAN8SQV5_SOLBU
MAVKSLINGISLHTTLGGGTII